MPSGNNETRVDTAARPSGRWWRVAGEVRRRIAAGGLTGPERADLLAQALDAEARAEALEEDGRP